MTLSKNTALPKTVKPWHPTFRLFVPKAFAQQQRKHAILALTMQNLRALKSIKTLVVRSAVAGLPFQRVRIAGLYKQTPAGRGLVINAQDT
jgi:hypothetical protein